MGSFRSAGAWALCLALAPLLGFVVIVLWIACLFKFAWLVVRGRERDDSWFSAGAHHRDG
jgi:hypothetical protein